MKRGLEFFKLRTIPVEAAIVELESQIGFQLSPIYRTFLLRYELGEGQLQAEERYNKRFDRFEIVGSISYQNTRPEVFLSINDFYDVHEIEHFWRSSDQYEVTGKEAHLLQIASLSSNPNGALYLGFGELNQDKIYHVNWDGGDERFTLVVESMDRLAEELFQQYDNISWDNE